MITKILIIMALVLCGGIAGFYTCLIYMVRRAGEGTCIRADDGEVYLRISEEGQIKLADPSTKILYLRVVDMSTRKKRPL